MNALKREIEAAIDQAKQNAQDIHAIEKVLHSNLEKLRELKRQGAQMPNSAAVESIHMTSRDDEDWVKLSEKWAAAREGFQVKDIAASDLDFFESLRMQYGCTVSLQGTTMLCAPAKRRIA